MTSDELQKIYDDIRKFVRYLAGRNADSNNIMLQSEEIEGELWVEFAKGIKRYGNLPHDELLAVIRRMMDNRIAELRYKYYLTHRSIYNHMENEDISDIIGVGSCVDAVDPETYCIAHDTVEHIAAQLSENARKIFVAIVYGDERITDQCVLAGMRKAYVYKGGGTVRLTPNIVSKALALDIGSVKESLREIKNIVRGYEQHEQ